MKNSDINNIYCLNGTVPLIHAIPIGLQHVLAMLIGNITPILIMAGVCNLDQDIIGKLVQNTMIIAGIGTLIQLFPIWKIGSGLPIVMGASFGFLNVLIFVGTNYDYNTVIGCVMLGGVFEAILGLTAKYWLRIVAPIVSALVVTTIGFSVLNVGATCFGGGAKATDFGSWQNWVVGSVTLLTCLGFQVYGKQHFKVTSVLLGLIVGYIFSVCLGMVDFSVLKKGPAFSLPAIFPFVPKFNINAIFSFLVIFIVSATETIGDTTIIAEKGVGRPVEQKQISGSLMTDGLISSFAGLLGCTPITSYSQNVGLVAMTKVVNRFTIAIGACFLIILGFFPILGVLFTTIPSAVLGGCTVMIFGTIMVTGIQMISKCGFTSRNMIIAAASLSIGIGFTQHPQMFKIFPDFIQNVFSKSAVAIVFVIAVILNLILPKNKEKTSEAEQENK